MWLLSKSTYSPGCLDIQLRLTDLMTALALGSKTKSLEVRAGHVSLFTFTSIFILNSNAETSFITENVGILNASP